MAYQSAQAELSEDLNGYVSWEHPPQKLIIYMHSTVVQAISTASLRCLKAKPPSEIGGLMWGKHLASREDVNKDSAIVSEVEFIPAEGDLYNTTPLDKRNLVRAVLNARNNDSNLALIGYFRSHVRDDFCLSQQDEEVIKESMCDSKQICLLVRPFEIGVCMAGFFFWQDGGLQTDVSDLEVPFIALSEPVNKTPAPTSASDSRHVKSQNPSSAQNAPETLQTYPDAKSRSYAAQVNNEPAISIPAQLSSITASTRMDAVSAELYSSAHIAPKQQQQSHAIPETSLFKEQLPSWVILTLTFGISAFIGAAAFHTLPTLRSRFESTSEYTRNDRQIRLQIVHAADGQLNLSWNPQISGSAKIQDAKLTINDHQIRKNLKLDPVQLRSGKLTYFSSGTDVEFRLEVYFDNGHSLAESVRMLSPEV